VNKKLFIFEFANNHMGDFKHGLHMIREYAKVINNFRALTNNNNFEFAIKFQFRDIDTFIHPDFKHRKELKYVRRFSETRLTHNNFHSLKEVAENEGFKTICTGFDEPSVELIGKMNFDYIKVASCSFTDWSLLKKIVDLDLPVIASTAGSKLEDVDSVVGFFKNRNKQLTIMHCVGQYPTKSSDLQLNQIDFLKKRYPEVEVGFSTHEEPDNYESIKIAIGKGAVVFEKHVAVVTEKYQKNAYSCTPEQINRWLLSANSAYEMCGVLGERYTPSTKEISDLRQFRRGVFAKKQINKGDIIDEENTFYAWPPQDDQVLANDMSMFVGYIAQKSFNVNEPIYNSVTKKSDTKERLLNIIKDVKTFLSQTGIVYPGRAKLEISHHYGIENFYKTGITMIPVINREYCKKYIIALPGQSHPEQYHKIKEETFIVLHGSVELYLNGELNLLKKGDVVTIKPNIRHMFKTNDGCVIEEISSTHYVEDSYYTDESIGKNKNRKTLITHWMD
jgi:sialic acid synthase SpsE/mannose-6-phosphate isomerase-like protein (cupin superfamily)